MHLLYGLALLVSLRTVHGLLDDKFHYYEIPTVSVHKVTKREAAQTVIKEVDVTAFGRNFTLELKPTKGLFANDFKVAVVHGDGSQEILNDFHRDRFMSGFVKGDDQSQASVHIGDDGVITGTFIADGEEYGIEPMSNHVNEMDVDFHDASTMVVYRRTDIKTDEHNTGLCGSVHPENNTEGGLFDEISFKTFNKDDGHGRKKRAATDLNTCSLVAVADYKYYSHLGQSNLFTTANYISNIIQRTNFIYRSTNFGGRVGYGFELKFMIIHDSPSVSSDQFYYNIAKTSWGTTELLQGFGRNTQLSEYCMALLFTSQAMPDSILGLAYIASKTIGTAGGLCSPQRTINGRRLSLNTAWMTSRNGAGNTITFTQHALVTAHGHAWGSEHDPSSGSCAPGSFIDDGKYLMYAYAVTGEDDNNDELSECSRNSIVAVLNSKGPSCLAVASVDDPCGNGRIDTGEECDGGFLGKLGLDPCCSTECLLNQGATCSAANFPCCENCLLASPGVLCQGNVEGSCEGESFCDGINLQCPSAPKLDNVACLDSGTCVAGVCTSYCEFRGMNSCLCDAVESSCKRCCRDMTTGICSVNDNLNLQNGRSCIQGYCENGVCKKVSTDMVERLWDLIDEISFDFLVESFRTNMVGCVIGFSLIVYIPICIIIWCVDRQRKKNWEKENSVHIRTDRNLAHDEDKRPIDVPTKPKAPSSLPSTLDPREFLSPSYARKPRGHQIAPLDYKPTTSDA